MSRTTQGSTCTRCIYTYTHTHTHTHTCIIMISNANNYMLAYPRVVKLVHDFFTRQWNQTWMWKHVR